jgi:hypothetical protein
MIFDLRFCPRSLRISILWERQADFSKDIVFGSKSARFSATRWNGGCGVAQAKENPRKTALELSSKFFCSDNFILQAAWMKPPRESFAMLVHTSVYWADSSI